VTVIAVCVFGVAVVVGAILERHLMARDQRARDREREQEWASERERLLDRMRDERHDWANERSALLDRIKPETTQPPPHLPGVETFQPPVDDAEYWDRAETE
jgi:hypothetical protein